MASYAANLETARNNVAARLAEITANPKPDYSVDGESYSWTSYFQALVSQLEALNKALQTAGGGWETKTHGRV